MKTFLIAIFTVLTTLSFSQNLEFEIIKGTVVDTVEITFNGPNSDTIISGKVSNIDTFYVKIINNTSYNFYIDDVLLSEDITIFQKNNLYDIAISYGSFDTNIEFDLTQIATTGLKENTQTVFSLYPNPTADFLNIKGDNVETVKVFNTSGQMVLSDKGSNFGDTKLDVTSLKNGVYMLMVNDGKPVRFIKR